MFRTPPEDNDHVWYTFRSRVAPLLLFGIVICWLIPIIFG